LPQSSTQHSPTLENFATEKMLAVSKLLLILSATDIQNHCPAHRGKNDIPKGKKERKVNVTKVT
jgi:hypothetical protein